MNRVAIALAGFAMLTAPAAAQSRPDSLRMSCAAASALVKRAGSIVIGTGPNIYDRYVADIGFCFRGQYTKASWIRTADTPQCFVGYRCVDYNPFFD